MGVRVDEAGRHHQAGGVEGLGRLLGDAADRADRHDAAVAHPDVAHEAGRAGAVDDGAAGDQVVEHVGSLQLA